MAHPIHIPRVNNNDDTVTVVRLSVRVGDHVRPGDPILEIETEKATVAVESERHGCVLAIRCQEGDALAVGDVAIWLGDTPDEIVPEPLVAPRTDLPDASAGDDMTGKARLLLRRHGLAADTIPRRGARLTAADIEAFVGLHPPGPQPADSLPALAELSRLGSAERGGLATVSWQRDHAAAAWLEIEYDPRPWRDHGAAFGKERRLLLDPTLALMAHRLALLAHATGANGTILEDGEPRRALYSQVNLGFTVQAGERLYLCVVERAETLDPAAFVARLGDLQRRAMAHRLTPDETRGTTVGFTSMARWGVQRHVPVLAPYSAVMVAHGAAFDSGSRAVLGIAYDHRLLSGFDAARLLQRLADPAGGIPAAMTPNERI